MYSVYNFFIYNFFIGYCFFFVFLSSVFFVPYAFFLFTTSRREGHEKKTHTHITHTRTTCSTFTIVSVTCFTSCESTRSSVCCPPLWSRSCVSCFFSLKKNKSKTFFFSDRLLLSALLLSVRAFDLEPWCTVGHLTSTRCDRATRKQSRAVYLPTYLHTVVEPVRRV